MKALLASLVTAMVMLLLADVWNGALTADGRFMLGYLAVIVHFAGFIACVALGWLLKD